jgi:magnesium-transporting ATPase (P-type)
MDPLSNPQIKHPYCQEPDPMIYALLIVGIISLFLGHVSDAWFIIGVLVFNAVIGTFQEYNAEKSAVALRSMATTHAIVHRDGESFEISSEEVVIGDMVFLESGSKIPADLRLISAQNLEIDESLFTGESLPVAKNPDTLFALDTPIAERKNMAYAGTFVTRGRAMGLVTATAIFTKLGELAKEVIGKADTKTPLLIRMEKFTLNLFYFMTVIIVLICGTLMFKGQSLTDVLVLSVALVVAAIPEGLPVVLTVALSIASRRMAKKNVIVRKLAAVEALGSCTYIGSDKTGTLTVNELTVKKISLPGCESWKVTGTGIVPEGEVKLTGDINLSKANELLKDLCRNVSFCNEGFLGRRNNGWVGHGDPLDVSLLVLAHKLGYIFGDGFKKLSGIPFESDNQYSATLFQDNEGQIISVKGAFERLLPMCEKMQTPEGLVDIDSDAINQSALDLAKNGFRVLAVASKNLNSENNLLDLTKDNLKGLNFIGLVGMIDPLRPEAREAVSQAKRAGVSVCMITGDHPITALAIARDLDLANRLEDVVTGSELRRAKTDEKMFDELVKKARVFARVEPQQKLRIVKSLQRQSNFVAITGDGANDAPALKAAHVGVAMGKKGTDVAREVSDLIIADDKFSSIISGIYEGRVAYSNLRKVIYLLISIGMGEIFLFAFSMIAGLPIPLTAVQLLWLNLVANGIQDVALAFEGPEGDELEQRPRSPNEPIFDRSMLEMVFLSSLVMGIVTYFFYTHLLSSGMDHAQTQNLVLLLAILISAIMIGNARSMKRSAFTIGLLRNPFLVIGTIVANLLHIWAMHNPFMEKILGVSPVTLRQWVECLLLALTVLVVMELYKFIRPLFKSSELKS